MYINVLFLIKLPDACAGHIFLVIVSIFSSLGLGKDGFPVLSTLTRDMMLSLRIILLTLTPFFLAHKSKTVRLKHFDRVRTVMQFWKLSYETFSSHRAEPILQRIKEDRTRVVSPSFDNIKYDTFELEEYPLSAQGFDWELWCRYLNPPKSWWTQRNHTAPIR